MASSNGHLGQGIGNIVNQIIRLVFHAGRINVQRHLNRSVTGQVLDALDIYSRFTKVRDVGMPQDMGRTVEVQRNLDRVVRDFIPHLALDGDFLFGVAVIFGPGAGGPSFNDSPEPPKPHPAFGAAGRAWDHIVIWVLNA